jgi:hypothetical protein
VRPLLRQAVVVGCLAALVLAVPLAWAAHEFTDVPDASPFHDSISAVKTAGITGGKTCVPPGTPPTFCPEETIVRQAMAAFLHRGLARVATGERLRVNVLDLTGSYQDVAVLTIEVGGVPGETQFVQVDGVLATTTDGTGCPCTTGMNVTQDGSTTGSTLLQQVTNGTDLVEGRNDQTATYSGVFPVESGGTYSFRLQARRQPTTGFTGTVAAYGSLTAITAPFGANGDDSLVWQP